MVNFSLLQYVKEFPLKFNSKIYFSRESTEPNAFITLALFYILILYNASLTLIFFFCLSRKMYTENGMSSVCLLYL